MMTGNGNQWTGQNCWTLFCVCLVRETYISFSTTSPFLIKQKRDGAVFLVWRRDERGRKTSHLAFFSFHLFILFGSEVEIKRKPPEKIKRWSEKKNMRSGLVRLAVCYEPHCYEEGQCTVCLFSPLAYSCSTFYISHFFSSECSTSKPSIPGH